MPEAVALTVLETAATVAYSATLRAVVFLAVSMAYSRNQQRKAAAKARAAYNASLRDRYVMSRDSTAPRQLVMGRQRVSGPMSFIGSTGADKEYLWFTVALASHEIDAIEQIYLDDRAVALSGSLSTGADVTTTPYLRDDDVSYTDSFTGNGSQVAFTLARVPIGSSVRCVVYSGDGDMVSETVFTVSSVVGALATLASAPANATNVKFSYQATTVDDYHVRLWARLGTAGQTAPAELLAAFPSLLTSAFKGTGTAYLVMRLKYNPDVFPSGLVNLSARVRGAKVYDPRDATTVWKENPALLMRWYALHPLGGNQPAGSFSDANVIAVANACDTSTVYTVGGVAQPAGVRYTAGMVANTASMPRDVLDELAEAMAGKWTTVDGQIRLRAGVHVASTQSLDASWLHNGGGITIAPRVRREDLFNVVQGTYAAHDKDYRDTEFKRIAPSAYITDDGGVELPLDAQFGAITRAGQVGHVAGVRLRDARNGLTVELTCNMRAYQVEPFDTIAVTLARYGWVAKLFEVLETGWTIEGGIRLVLKETASTIYDVDAGFDAEDDTPNTELPDPWLVPAVSGLAAASGTDHLLQQLDGSITTRVRVQWTAIANANVRQGGKVELRWGRAATAESTWRTEIALGSDTQAYLLGAREGWNIVVKARAVTANGLRGKWSAHVPHLVVGKSQPPSDVTGLTATAIPGAIRINWNLPNDIDYETTELRQYSSAVWASGLRLDTGAAGSMPAPGGGYNWAWPAAGTYWIMARHRDGSGNLSSATLAIEVTVTATGIAITDSELIGGVGGANLLLNSSFEADTNADGLSNSWLLDQSGTVGTVTASRSAPARDGLVSQRISSSGFGADGNVGLRQDVFTDSFDGQWVTLAVDVQHTSGTSLRLAPTFYDDAGVSLGTEIQDFASTSNLTWYRRVARWQAPALTARVRVRMQMVNGSGGAAAIRYDRAALQIGGVGTQWAPKPDELLPNVATEVVAQSDATVSGSIASGVNRRQEVLSVVSWTNDTGESVNLEISFRVSLKATASGGAYTSAKVRSYVTTSATTAGTESDLTNTAYSNIPDTLNGTEYRQYVNLETYTLANGATLYAVLAGARQSNTETTTTFDGQDAMLRITAIKR